MGLFRKLNNHRRSFKWWLNHSDSWQIGIFSNITQSAEEIEIFRQSAIKCPKSGLHNPIKNP